MPPGSFPSINNLNPDMGKVVKKLLKVCKTFVKIATLLLEKIKCFIDYEFVSLEK